MRSILLLLGLLLASSVSYAVPTTMDFQGQLTTGSTLVNGTKSITFRLFNAESGGTAFWTETQSLSVTNGLFNAMIGTNTPLPVSAFDGSTKWVEIAVEGTTMTGRRPLGSVSYSFRAAYADTAGVALTTLGGGTASTWETDGTNVWRSAGSVGIGTETPSADATFGSPVLCLKGSRPTLSLTTTATNGLATLQLNGPTQNSSFHLNFSDGTDPAIGLYSYKLGDYMMFLRGTGNIGIGIQVPEAKLHVAGDAIVNNFSARGDGSFARPGGSGFNIQTPSSDVRLYSPTNVPLHLGTNGNAFMLTIDPSGNVTIPGNLSVNGTKCRAVETEFGTLRMNAVESAHALFMDDEPSARLVDGKCRVDLSPKFMSTVTVNGQYPLAVNVTFYGPHGGNWYVERDATGFTVIDPSGSNAEFSWQAIARQKNYETTNLDAVSSAAGN